MYVCVGVGVGPMPAQYAFQLPAAGPQSFTCGPVAVDVRLQGHC